MHLRNILVAALRDVEFFNPDTAWVDEKPGYFLPLRTVRCGQRQRYANIPHYMPLLLTTIC